MFRRPAASEPASPAPSWPPEFDPAVYVRHRTNRDLSWLSPGAAARHYARHGRREGRVGSAVASRAELLSLIPAGARILEIGPFFAPLVARARFDVAYLDVLDTSALRARAATIPEGDPARCRRSTTSGAAGG